jgi:hypothetical protein
VINVLTGKKMADTYRCKEMKDLPQEKQQQLKRLRVLLKEKGSGITPQCSVEFHLDQARNFLGKDHFAKWAV